MQIASRIRQVRIEHFLSLEELALRTGLSRSLLASFENGQEMPSREMFDSLADAAGVPVKNFFYADSDSQLTPRLTLRLTLHQLVDEPSRSASAVIASLLSLQILRAATRGLLSFITKGDCGLTGEIPNSSLNSSNPQAPDADEFSEDTRDSEPGS